MLGSTQTEVATGVTVDFDRRSRGVLVADIVGYTRLMENAELETHKRCRAMRVGLIDPAIISHRGELVKNTGDGFVAVFESPLDALRCALDLQKEVTHAEALQTPDRRITFRMGLNWGPVILDLNDIYGHGVNIAQRLQSAAPAGGIVVSAALLSVGRPNLDLKLDDLGELHLKNLSRAVHAFSVILPGVDRTAATGRGLGSAKLPAIAVLPFANLSSDPGASHFSAGFVEDIIASLTNIRELFVVSRGSTLMFRERDVDALEVSEKLGVRYLLRGSVRLSDQRLRVSTELIDAADGLVMWAEKYDATLQQVFDLQDDITISIVGEIARHVRRAEVTRALRKAPQNLNAYEHLLRALDLLYKFDFASFIQARTHLEKAREADDSYAAAYAYAANWHIFNIAEGWSSDTEADATEIIRLSTAAIERDPTNALALSLQGHGRSMFFREYDAALDLFDRALAIAPNHSPAWVFSSGTYGFIGDARSGITRAERAIQLSPLDQQSFFNLCLLGQNHYLNGTFDEAIRWSQKAVNINPRFGNAARVLAASLVAAGRMEEARLVALQHGMNVPRFRVSEYARRCPFKQPQASIYVERLKTAGVAE